MKNLHDIEDDEIRVVGGEQHKDKSRPKWWLWTLLAVIVVAIIALLLFQLNKDRQVTPPTEYAQANESPTPDIWHNNVDADIPSGILITDTLADSLHLQIFTPYNTNPELHMGKLNTEDSTIVFAAMAADLRRDNGKIVGAFVYAGEPLSWGLSKRGYCAIIDDHIALGVAENSPLFEQATEQGGYFFRQYPAVDHGEIVANNPENASFRRALCLMMDGRICIIASTDRVLMNDFSSTLVRLGVSDAIFLVGGTAHGWYRNSEGNVVMLGQDLHNAKNINYIIFRRQ